MFKKKKEDGESKKEKGATQGWGNDGRQQKCISHVLFLSISLVVLEACRQTLKKERREKYKISPPPLLRRRFSFSLSLDVRADFEVVMVVGTVAVDGGFPIGKR
jgi:hypothetical protein